MIKCNYFHRHRRCRVAQTDIFTTLERSLNTDNIPKKGGELTENESRKTEAQQETLVIRML